MSPNVVADATANVDQKVIAAAIAGAEINAIAGRLVTIEASALPSDAAHEIEAGLRAQLRLVHAIQGKQDRAEGNAKSGVISLASLPGSLKIEADALVEDDISADAWVEATLFGYEATTPGYGARGRPRGHDRAASEHGISLLRLGETGQTEESTNCREERQLSQEGTSNQFTVSL